MKFLSAINLRHNSSLVITCILLIILGVIRWFFDGSTIFIKSPAQPHATSSSIGSNKKQIIFYRRQGCSCARPIFEYASNVLVVDETSSSLCSQYATFRGFHQRIIAISMYGPKENTLFSFKTSLNFLYELIDDMTNIYPGWILRIYHDSSIKEDIICPIECAHNHVDFCNASAMGNLRNVNSYMPPKIWRFLPVGDPLVDVMGSRDLDSPLAQRELDAVNYWLSTNKQWHVMRDHPLHTVPMLGGMWGFRPELNRTMARQLLNQILNRSLVSRYTGRGDQTFLTDYVWPHIQEHLLAHDSHLCTTWYGKNSEPWPTRRPLLNATGCFVGCVRPCCRINKHPFGECPVACRPKNHTDWTMC
ncbi:unnamed protein product [Rotaria socialis]|uniref:Uncharacterized protein n=1 Tax=Rotaria socialis TaxID=392032 RepID=A0A820ZW23_9BILA|nr:unnamed protein product [Rotaria socialis]CAF3521319.1 unnamed protein product [Rotaria socialis]CAF3621272.1 unnamed protein product [Rotaria socialis]CAF3653386.1 unnamed protein product [Rotaria socialis]CAF4125713.1 unnamed protein product [Rotaria socialis]